MERPSGRLTGIYILSSAICVSELCRVTVARRIRSRKSVIITRAAVLALFIFLVHPATRSSGDSTDKKGQAVEWRGGQNSLSFPALFSHPLFVFFTLRGSLSFTPRNKQVNTSHPPFQRSSLSLTRSDDGSDFTLRSGHFSLHLPPAENEIIAFLYAWRSRPLAHLSLFLLAPSQLFHMFRGLLFGRNYTRNV